jgi:hypothetical protein
MGEYETYLAREKEHIAKYQRGLVAVPSGPIDPMFFDDPEKYKSDRHYELRQFLDSLDGKISKDIVDTLSDMSYGVFMKAIKSNKPIEG